MIQFFTNIGDFINGIITQITSTWSALMIFIKIVTRVIQYCLNVTPNIAICGAFLYGMFLIIMISLIANIVRDLL